jgi:type I restriction enzyme S subunit
LRDSRIPWLGSLPDHWDVKRLKYLLRERDLRSGDGREQLLRVSQYTGVTERKSAEATNGSTDSRAESLIGYKLVEPNELVVNIMLAWNGSLGVSRYSGIASPAYCVYRFSGEVDPWYFHYLLRSPLYRARIKAVSTGVVDSRLRLYTDDLYALPVPLPPVEEQRAIVRFLNHADRRIRRAIRAKQELIALLSEQKQGVIHRAVTRGLDPNVRLKPSGVDWLGDVPEHWSVYRLRFLANITTGGRDTIDRVDGGEYPFFVRSQTVEQIDTYSFDGEAVLTAGDGAGVAKVFHYIDGKFDVHQRVYRFSNFRKVTGRFFFYYLSNSLKFEAFRGTAKSTVESLRRPMLADFPIAVPPAAEQEEIVFWIQASAAAIDHATATAQREIDLLREYRSSLIAEVVTGKVDVREAAAGLLDEADEPGPLEGVDVEEFEDSARGDLEPVEA